MSFIKKNYKLWLKIRRVRIYLSCQFKQVQMINNGILKGFFVLVILFGLFSKPSAQTTDIGNWFIYFGNQQISKKWNWWNEVQYRNYNAIGDMEQLLLRTGIGYNISENNNNLLLGYGLILARPYIPNTKEKDKLTEHRIYQQFITRQEFGRVYIQHRYRIEERFRESVFSMRFRYYLGLNVPITKPKMQKSALYASAYNEIFLNFKSPVFDRDRVYGALGYAISKTVRVEAGLMYQIYESRNRPQFQFVVFNNMPLYKK
jgi:hypothetical protein